MVGHGDIADRAAEHFRSCVQLLDRYDPRGGAPVNASIVDVRPSPSDCDFMGGDEKQALTRGSWRELRSSGEHWTMIAGANAVGAADILVQSAQ